MIENESCLIDWASREVIKPEGFAPVGVESDELVNPIRFEAPRYYKGCDLSEFSFRVNYQNAEGDDDVYLVDDLDVQDETVSFTWRLSRLATLASGSGSFVVCAVRLADDGETVLQEINSTVASFEVLEGFEVGDAAEYAVRLDWLNAVVAPMVEAEAARVANEGLREIAEADRIGAEAEREEAEDEREVAEASRQATFADMVATISEAKVLILDDGQYDEDGRPTIEGAPGIVYFVPVDASNDEDDGYIEWVCLDGEWERMGTTQANLVAISPDNVDYVVEDENPEGNEVLTLSGLSYLWGKLKQEFAALTHKHSASDITSGAFTGERIADKAIGPAKLADSVNPTSLIKTVEVKTGFTVAANGFTYVEAPFTVPSGYTAIAVPYVDGGDQSFAITGIILGNGTVGIGIKNLKASAVTKSNFLIAKVTCIKNL